MDCHDDSSEFRRPGSLSYPWLHLVDQAWPRFLLYVSATDPLGCWLWRGGVSRGQGKEDNYGSFWVGENFSVRAHIFAAVAGGDETWSPSRDHLCRNTLCMNPLHLERVTKAENNRRQWVARRSWTNYGGSFDHDMGLGMTKREAEILTILERLIETSWVRPMDFGGEDATYHAKVAARMVPKGWMARRRVSTIGGRGHWEWRITDKGRVAVANHRFHSTNPGAGT